MVILKLHSRTESDEIQNAYRAFNCYQWHTQNALRMARLRGGLAVNGRALPQRTLHNFAANLHLSGVAGLAIPSATGGGIFVSLTGDYHSSSIGRNHFANQF